VFKQSGANGILSTWAQQGFQLPPLYLVDVGVSGGINPVWRAWGDALHALGIDILSDEIARLKSAETAPHVRYEAVKVAGATTAPVLANRTNYALHRSAAYMGTALLADSAGGAIPSNAAGYRQYWNQIVSGERFPPPTEANFTNVPAPLSDPFYRHYQKLFEMSLGLSDPRYSREEATLDEILARHGWSNVDLLKIDTDGYEHDVLTGAEDLLARGCLAIEIEVQFHGPQHDGANVFSEIDRTLRQRGYTLAKLMPYTYARSALPRPFVYPHLPAQTNGGPIQWADAIYVRDPLQLGSGSFTTRQLQILAAILDSYELEDYAAEVILARPEAFQDLGDALLDSLAGQLYGDGCSYGQAIQQFLDGTSKFKRP